MFVYKDIVYEFFLKFLKVIKFILFLDIEYLLKLLLKDFKSMCLDYVILFLDNLLNKKWFN